MTLVEEIEEQLEAAFPEADIEVSGGDGRYRIEISSAEFAGLSRLRQQQAVYAAGVGELIKSGTVHAVTIKASAPGGAQ